MSTFEWQSRPRLRHPIAILAFSGWGDAGESSTDAVHFLASEYDAEPIGQFESDPFFDFQVNRPVVSLDEDGVRSLEWPTTEVVAVRLEDRDLVVVVGEEPNYNWKRFVTDLCDVLTELGVETAVTMGAFVGQVPHTRPVPVVGSSTSAGLVSTFGLLPSRYEGPTGIVGVLTAALATRDIATCSLWAAVPHYLSNQSYPPGVEALIRKAAEIAGVNLDLSELTEQANDFRLNVDAAVDGSDELADYVRQLEEVEMEEGDPGENLVEEIEQYLREK